MFKTAVEAQIDPTTVRLADKMRRVVLPHYAIVLFVAHTLGESMDDCPLHQSLWSQDVTAASTPGGKKRKHGDADNNDNVLNQVVVPSSQGSDDDSSFPVQDGGEGGGVEAGQSKRKRKKRL